MSKTFELDGVTYNGAQVSSVGPVREIKRAKPKVEGGEGTLPPVYNFTFKVGYESVKSPDFESIEPANNLRSDIVRAME